MNSGITRLALSLTVLMFLTAGKPAPPPAPFDAEIAVGLRTSDGRDILGFDSSLTKNGKVADAPSGLRYENAVFSPDGGEILFYGDIEGPGLYRKANTTSVTAITKVIATNKAHSWVSPSWSPDGRFVIYADVNPQSSFEGGDDYDLYLLELDANRNPVDSPLNLTPLSGYAETFPAWSPDGTEVAALVWVDGNHTQLLVYGFDVLTASLTPARPVTPFGQIGYLPGRPAWTRAATLPRGLVYSCQVGPADGAWDLCYSDATMTNTVPRVLLSRSNTHYGYPSFSPDERLVMTYSPGKRYVSVLENAGDVITLGSAPVIRNIRTISPNEDVVGTAWR